MNEFIYDYTINYSIFQLNDSRIGQKTRAYNVRLLQRDPNFTEKIILKSTHKRDKRKQECSKKGYPKKDVAAPDLNDDGARRGGRKDNFVVPHCDKRE